MESTSRESLRERLINKIATKTGSSPRLLWAMRQIPREVFVLPACVDEAYEDKPLAIGWGQTISQPSMVAIMTDLLSPEEGSKVLEVGTGSGYQAAILGLLSHTVVTVERYPALAIGAARRLGRLGLWNVKLLTGDGTLGWPDAAPFDRIIVTAAAPSLPVPLWEQLAEGGIMVIPIGTRGEQVLYRIVKKNGAPQWHAVVGCRFVPLVGRFGWPDESG